MLQDGKVDFDVRSTRPAVTDVIKVTKKVTVGKWIQTTGKGLEEATEVHTKVFY